MNFIFHRCASSLLSKFLFIGYTFKGVFRMFVCCWLPLSMKCLPHLFVATSFSSSIVGWNSLTWFMWFVIQKMVGVWIGWLQGDETTMSSSNDFKFNSFDHCSSFILLGPILLLMSIGILFYSLKPNLYSNYLWLDLHCHIFLMFQKLQALLLRSLSYFFRKNPYNNPHHLFLLFFKKWFLWWCSSFSFFVHTSFD